MSKTRIQVDTIDPVTRFLADVEQELHFARKKFPEADVNFAALVEEVGELAKAVMEEDLSHVRSEAIQVAAMACRIVVDGDPTLDDYRATYNQPPLASNMKDPTDEDPEVLQLSETTDGGLASS